MCLNTSGYRLVSKNRTAPVPVFFQIQYIFLGAFKIFHFLLIDKLLVKWVLFFIDSCSNEVDRIKGMFPLSACAVFTGPIGGHTRKTAEVLTSVLRVIVGEERRYLNRHNHIFSDGNMTMSNVKNYNAYR